jgi:predicted 3-demethylubiquinone-9 3-methyltransferase (glyoxalase superfamily)/uncharacterized protein YndB with AHSA1/START domain
METIEKTIITVEATVNAPVQKVWKLWTTPEHITMWNNASDDWHTPHAENDVRVGGNFLWRMEAKDGSFGFNFVGVYNEIKTNELIVYTIGDGRRVKITFSSSGNNTRIEEIFEAETTNPIEMQRDGWQAILDNFKKYAELDLKSSKTPSVTINRITPCLWFDTQAEEAAKFYTKIFKNSEIGTISRYGKEGFEFHGMPEGTVLTVSFKLDGQDFTALNGGPKFKFNEALSFVVGCETQEEIDYFWTKLTEGGEEGQCGWLKDKFGLSWQIVPNMVGQLMSDPNRAGRVMQALLQMRKFNIEKLLQA